MSIKSIKDEAKLFGEEAFGMDILKEAEKKIQAEKKAEAEAKKKADAKTKKETEAKKKSETKKEVPPKELTPKKSDDDNSYSGPKKDETMIKIPKALSDEFSKAKKAVEDAQAAVKHSENLSDAFKDLAKQELKTAEADLKAVEAKIQAEKDRIEARNDSLGLGDFIAALKEDTVQEALEVQMEILGFETVSTVDDFLQVLVGAKAAIGHKAKKLKKK